MNRKLSIALTVPFAMVVLSEIVNLSTGDGGSAASPFILAAGIIGLVVAVVRIIRTRKVAKPSSP